MNYDTNNVFARILRGEVACQVVYQDADTMAFMDIGPRCRGHTLVIPKTAARNMLDASPEQLAACMTTVHKIARAAMRAFGATGVTVQQTNEPAGGQDVFHLHYHVIPRYEGVPMGPPAGPRVSDELLDAHAAELRNALADC